MVCRITHIRLSDHFASSTDKITHIKLESGVVETTGMVAHFIDWGCKYTYTNKEGKEIFVGSVHPEIGTPYIQTLSASSDSDELLFLPIF